MNLNFEIKSFQASGSPEALIIVGIGSDGWMYQFLGEEGVWSRLSQKFPKRMGLNTDINSLTTNTMDIEKPMTEEEVAAVAQPPAEEASKLPESEPAAE